MSLNGSLTLIVGAHAPMTGYVSVVHLRWPCVPWRYEPVVAIVGKKTQKIIHWSTHMFSGSCEELALADGETQATDTP